jgi:gluconate 2-dehydrogenase gamma chain
MVPASKPPASASDPAGSPAAPGLPRRVVITAISAIPAVVASASVLGSTGCTSSAPGSNPPAPGARIRRFFTGHEATVVEDATARIAPGPRDDPAEAGHPGAREAAVTDYIDMMLGSLGAVSGTEVSGGPPPMVFAGGPWSNRHTSGPDLMASFVTLDPVTRIAWRKRLTGWQQRYRQGIAALDKLAGGDFTRAAPAEQDKILATQSVSTFTALLFEHTIEGLYANPEYGGNRGLTGWKDIGFPGDSQPRGYTGDEVERSDGREPVDDTGVVAAVLKLLGAL